MWRASPAGDEHHQDHQQHGFNQGVEHFFDGGSNEGSCVVDKAVTNTLGEGLLELIHLRPDFVRDIDGVGAGQLEDQ